MESRGTANSLTILKKKNTAGRLALPGFKAHYEATRSTHCGTDAKAAVQTEGVSKVPGVNPRRTATGFGSRAEAVPRAERLWTLGAGTPGCPRAYFYKNWFEMDERRTRERGSDRILRGTRGGDLDETESGDGCLSRTPETRAAGEKTHTVDPIKTKRTSVRQRSP